jgi:XTP/dITP diphosphohydrolase
VNSTQTALQKLVETVKSLRDPVSGCPWDLAQTAESLTPYILEEAYETVHAIKTGTREEIIGELGDLLLQIVLQAQIASETNNFDLADIANSINEKLIRRHPHVFGDRSVTDVEEVKANWEKIKAEERGNPDDLLSSKLSRYAEQLPPMTAAMKISKKAAAAGFEWSDIGGVWAKFEEELGEFKEALATDNIADQESELGDLLFTVVNLARWFDLDPVSALQGTNQRFVDRLKKMEKFANRPLTKYTIDELESLWQQAKKAIVLAIPPSRGE